MPITTCSIPGCRQKCVARRLCRRHYTRWYRHGDPTLTLHRKTCSIPGCTGDHRSRGLCNLHYSRWLSHGSTEGTRHGGHGTRLYDIWTNIRSRCLNPNSQRYHRYGGRGITFHEGWHDFAVFRDWAYANGYVDQPADTPRKDRLSIDREDNDGNYEPANCEWITRSENSTRGQLARWARYRAARDHPVV